MRSIIALRRVCPSFDICFKLTNFVFFARWNDVILHLHEQIHVRVVMLIISAYIYSVIYLILLVFRDSISISPFSITWNVRYNWFYFIVDLFLYKGNALVEEKRIRLDNVVKFMKCFVNWILIRIYFVANEVFNRRMVGVAVR